MQTITEVYLFGGLALASEIPLPELPRMAPEAAPAHGVTICLGNMPASVPAAVELDPGCFATSSQYLLRVPGVAQYFVSDGREIVVRPEENALALDVRAYLLSTVFAVLCHQRGLLPLHACAVSAVGGVIAFLAHSGEGKSSLAAHLARRGFRVVADDICLIELGQGNESDETTAMVIPVAPWLKLWRASLQNLGEPIEELGQVFSDDDKYRLPLAPSSIDNPQRQREALAGLVFLERSEGIPNAPAGIHALHRAEAISRLMNLTHQASLVQATGRRRENFLRCGQVLSQAKAYRLVRPWGWSHMESTVDCIERFFPR